MLHNPDVARAARAEPRRIAVAHVVASLDPVHGGPSHSVPRLCRALEDAGARARLFSVEAPGEAPPAADNVEAVFAADMTGVPVLGRLRCSVALARRLRAIAPELDIVHGHGLWLMPNVQPAAVARRAGIPVVVSPRGMFGPEALAYSRWKKRLSWSLLQRRAVHGAACIHATSEQEYREVRAFGLRNPIALVANGVDVPDQLPQPRRAEARRQVLSLGRLHPKKGLDRLLRAWARIEAGHPQWRLRLIGPDPDGYGTVLRALADDLGIAHVTIEPPLAGEARLVAYHDAGLFVLPTLNDNFASTVAESLAAGTPVIASTGSPWSGLEANGCGWWVEPSVDSLAEALGRAMALAPARLAAMGARGRAWMTRDFSWRQAGQEMLTVYRWLRDGGAPPACVRLQ
jgi:glycosyltransferase involved in cell wall biosynthesis